MVPSIRTPLEKGMSTREYFTMIRFVKAEKRQHRHKRSCRNTEDQISIGTYGAIGRMHSPSQKMRRMR